MGHEKGNDGKDGELEKSVGTKNNTPMKIKPETTPATPDHEIGKDNSQTNYDSSYDAVKYNQGNTDPRL